MVEGNHLIIIGLTGRLDLKVYETQQEHESKFFLKFELACWY